MRMGRMDIVTIVVIVVVVIASIVASESMAKDEVATSAVAASAAAISTNLEFSQGEFSRVEVHPFPNGITCYAGVSVGIDVAQHGRPWKSDGGIGIQCFATEQ